VSFREDPIRIAEESQRELQIKTIWISGKDETNEENLMLKIGDKSPAFRLPSDEGKDIGLKDFQGRRVLIFFYPKANTSG
jgi:peroxiredoxin